MLLSRGFRANNRIFSRYSIVRLIRLTFHLLIAQILGRKLSVILPSILIILHGLSIKGSIIYLLSAMQKRFIRIQIPLLIQYEW